MSWWQRNWFVIFLLYFFPPIGIILALVKPDWRNRTKAIASVLSFAWMSFLLLLNGGVITV